jgi:hypothetical protein
MLTVKLRQANDSCAFHDTQSDSLIAQSDESQDGTRTKAQEIAGINL